MNPNNKTSDFTKILTSALSSISGAAKDVKSDLELKILNYLEKLDVAKTEEVELVKAMVCELRKEQEVIKKRISELENKKLVKVKK